MVSKTERRKRIFERLRKGTEVDAKENVVKKKRVSKGEAERLIRMGIPLVCPHDDKLCDAGGMDCEDYFINEDGNKIHWRCARLEVSERKRLRDLLWLNDLG